MSQKSLPGVTARLRFCWQSFAYVLALAGFALLAPAALAAEGRRLAFVVGNSAYDRLEPLRNAASDATAIGQRLEALGFEVEVLTNATAADFNTRLDQIVARAEGAEAVLFYYAGHAFQMDGVNHLVPVSARLAGLDAVRNETWNLDTIIARLQHRSRQTLIFLDACRNDPRPASARESGARDGLARVQIGDSTFVAFATAPGMVTYDGAESAGHSPFTAALLDNIGTPGQSISDLMIRVRNQVEQRAFRRQTPWEQSSLLDQFHFASAPGLSVSSEDLARLASRPETEREAAFDALRMAGMPQEQISQMRGRVDFLTDGLATAGGSGGIALGAPAPAGDRAAQPAPSVSRPAPADLAALPRPPAAGLGADLFGNLPSASQSGQVSFGDAPPPIRLAALSPGVLGAVRGIPAMPAPGDGMLRQPAISSRLLGKELDRDSPEGCAVLHAFDPDRYPACTFLDPAALARLVQTQLQRIGCYSGRVDGSWGNGSRAALGRYYAAKPGSPDDGTEPSPGLLARLEAERDTLCAPVAAVAPARPSPATTSSPSRREPATRPASSRPTQPATRRADPPPRPAAAPPAQAPARDNMSRLRRIIN